MLRHALKRVAVRDYKLKAIRQRHEKSTNRGNCEL